MEYLDFELPIKDIIEQLDKCKIIGDESEVDVTDTCEQLEQKLIDTKKEIYGNLTLAKSTIIPSSFASLYFRLYPCFMWG